MKVFLLILMLSSAAFAFDGIERGNGTDIHDKADDAAWFTGAEKTIRYCISSTAKFPVGEDVLQRNIESAFQAWQYYDVVKKTHADIPFRGIRVQECIRADLRFHFIDSILSPMPRVAFAQRSTYNPKSGWGSGDIWVGDQTAARPNAPFPDWTNSTHLRSILIHELGHVFGVPHIEGTVMSSDLVTALTSDAYDLPSIDGVRQLVRGTDPLTGVLALPFQPAQEMYHECRDETDELFQILTGRSPVGKVSAQFDEGALIVRDARDSFDFNLKFESGGADMVSTFIADLFYISREIKGEVRGESFARHMSGVRYGQLQTRNGMTMMVLWEQNMNSEIRRGPVAYRVTGDVLKWISPDGPRLLFTSSYQVAGPVQRPKINTPDFGTCKRAEGP